MPVATHRRTRLPLSRPSRTRTTTPSTIEAADASYREIYEMLSEAAHLVSRASRHLRHARQDQAGVALEAVVAEIHENIRRLPPPVRQQAITHRHRRYDLSEC